MKVGKYTVTQNGDTVTLDTGRRLNGVWLAYGIVAVTALALTPLGAILSSSLGATILTIAGVALAIVGLMRAGATATRNAIAPVRRTIVIGPPAMQPGYRVASERTIAIDGAPFPISRVRDVVIRIVESQRTIYNLYIVLDDRAFKVQNTFEFPIVAQLSQGIRQALGAPELGPAPTTEPITLSAAIWVTLPLILYCGAALGIPQLTLAPYMDGPTSHVRAIIAGPVLLAFDGIFTLLWGLVLRGPARTHARLMFGLRS